MEGNITVVLWVNWIKHVTRIILEPYIDNWTVGVDVWTRLLAMTLMVSSLGGVSINFALTITVILWFFFSFFNGTRPSERIQAGGARISNNTGDRWPLLVRWEIISILWRRPAIDGTFRWSRQWCLLSSSRFLQALPTVCTSETPRYYTNTTVTAKHTMPIGGWCLDLLRSLIWGDARCP